MRRLTCFCLLAVGLTADLHAHDMWLVEVDSGHEPKVCSRIGERFPDSVNTVTPERVTLFQLRSHDGTTKLTGAVEGKQLCAPVAVSDGVAEMIVQPRLNRIPAPRFAEFVKGEGLEGVVKAPSRTDGEVSYLYSRFSKIVFGVPGPMATKPVGHVLEIVPETDPAQLQPGKALVVTVLFQGKPLPNAQIAALHEGDSAESFNFPVKTRTDTRGRATLMLDRPGLWYARLIYSIPADDPEFQWRHFFATLTFRAAVAIATPR